MPGDPQTTPIFAIDIPDEPPPRRGPPFTRQELELAEKTAAVGRIGAGTVWMGGRVKHLQRRGLLRVEVASRWFADVSLTPDAKEAMRDDNR